jgi:hypothetical protein
MADADPSTTGKCTGSVLKEPFSGQAIRPFHLPGHEKEKTSHLVKAIFYGIVDEMGTKSRKLYFFNLKAKS